MQALLQIYQQNVSYFLIFLFLLLVKVKIFLFKVKTFFSPHWATQSPKTESNWELGIGVGGEEGSHARNCKRVKGVANVLFEILKNRKRKKNIKEKRPHPKLKIKKKKKKTKFWSKQNETDEREEL